MLSLFTSPETWSWQNILLFSFRILGGLTFIVWPGVLVAGIMGAAGHVSKETAFTAVLRFLYVASIAYPLIFIAIWKWADYLKTSQPLLALFINALPVLVIGGAVGVYALSGYMQFRKVNQKNQALIQQIEEGLKAQDYEKAFQIFSDPERHSEVYLLEESTNPGFSLKNLILSSLGTQVPTKALIEKMIDYARPSVEGVTDVHRAYMTSSRIDSTDESAAMISLLLHWKNSGLQMSRLSYPHQWVWDHLTIYLNVPRKRPASEILKNENELLSQVLNFYSDEAQFKELLQKFPVELLNKKGDVFGTPLHALLLDELMHTSPNNLKRIQWMWKAGARLQASEENEMNTALLKKILSE
jgi:hypothetical protein